MPEQFLSALAPAKINLYLDILRRRDDGFHELATLFANVALSDRLVLERLPEGSPEAGVSVDGPFAEGVPTDGRNLAWRAVERVCGVAGVAARFRLHLTKNIPHGAGLGGGSSDAAAALRLANLGLGTPLDGGMLHRLAAELGSDCAYFLEPGPAIGRGRGEQLERLPCGREPLPCLLVLPGFAVSTREAYQRLDPAKFGAVSDEAAWRRWMADPGAPTPAPHNHFEAALDQSHPELGAIRSALRKRGAFAALLSGSGSASWGLFDSESARDAAADSLAGTYRVLPTVALPVPGTLLADSMHC
jgi:4-diphosphocytidyl-2-C-methyl-D-erythritol kinase